MPSRTVPPRPTLRAWVTRDRATFGHYWFESRNRLILWAIRRYFPEARTFLEIGCGTGFVLQGIHAAFPALDLTATDLMPGGIACAKRRVPSGSFLQVDARELDMPSRFDVVGAFDVLEHIPEDQRVLERLFRAVRPGGGAIATVPQHPALWSRMDEYGCHVRRYGRRELVDRLNHAGFAVVRTTSFVSLLLPLMAMSRWRDKWRRAPFDVNREFDVPLGMNGAFRFILTVERAFIQAGVSWPAGGSLLAIVRKPRTKRALTPSADTREG